MLDGQIVAFVVVLACVVSVSVRFGSKEREMRVKDRAKNKVLVPFFARPTLKIPFLVVSRSFFAPKPHRNACYAAYRCLEV